MQRLTITPAAENDLLTIWLFIARDNVKAADQVFQAASMTFDSLAAMPRMGTLFRSRRARLKGVRFFPISDFPNYIVYYREQAQGLEIIRILHARMDRRKRLIEG